ncbi:unnamed protein product [Cochlearia groenlandica]
MRLLHRQLGIKNFAHLKLMFLDLFSGSHSYLRASSSSHVVPLAIEGGWKVLRLFLSILHTIPLVVVESRREVDEVKELVTIDKEYVLGLKMELRRRDTKYDPIRQQELVAYFTNCNLQAPHLRLALLSAMLVCYKILFVICGSTYVPIYRGKKDVSCPYYATRFVPSQEGNMCTVCDLAVVGADASGLVCSQSQFR